MRASKYGANGAKNTGSSSNTSPRAHSAGNTNSSDGKIASHNVGWSLTVLSKASIPSSPRVRGHLLAQTPPAQGPPRPRLFQVEVARVGSSRRPCGCAGTGKPKPGVVVDVASAHLDESPTESKQLKPRALR